jgi:hypothetical protein
MLSFRQGLAAASTQAGIQSSHSLWNVKRLCGGWATAISVCLLLWHGRLGHGPRARRPCHSPISLDIPFAIGILASLWVRGTRDEKNISAIAPQTAQRSWLQETDVHAGRPRCAQAPSCQRAQTFDSDCLQKRQVVSGSAATADLRAICKSEMSAEMADDCQAGIC